METPISFSDFPIDVHLNILSFLQPLQISAFACTCRRFAALCRPSSPALYHALCYRRWSSTTNLRRWSAAPSPLLYKTLDRLETLIGFWRRIDSATPSLLLFEWRPSCITAFRISPSPAIAAGVCKIPFIWIGLSAAGEILSYLHPFVPVTVNFVGCNHFVVEERRSDDDRIVEAGVMSEMYEYFANRASPGAERNWRRLRKKKKDKRWEADHFVRIENCFPTTDRPLQGLWKVIMY